jgi:hypothetical protein
MDTKLETSMLDFMNDTKEIDKLLESETSATSQQVMEQQLNNTNPMTQTTPYYYSNDWITKHELF